MVCHVSIKRFKKNNFSVQKNISIAFVTGNEPTGKSGVKKVASQKPSMMIKNNIKYPS